MICNGVCGRWMWPNGHALQAPGARAPSGGPLGTRVHDLFDKECGLLVLGGKTKVAIARSLVL